MLECLNTFRETPSDALATIEELLAKQLAHALDAVTVVDIGIAHADAIVDRLERTRDELSTLMDESRQHIAAILERSHSDRKLLRRLAQKRQDRIYESLKQIRVDLDAATSQLEDVDERIRVARETLISMNSLQLHQMPSPVGCDLKELGGERRQIASRVDMCLTLESNSSDSLDSIAELLQMLQTASKAADHFGQMADLVGKVGLNRVMPPRRRVNDVEQQTMLAVINGLAADRMLQSKLESVINKTEEARAAVSLRIVEIVSQFWR